MGQNKEKRATITAALYKPCFHQIRVFLQRLVTASSAAAAAATSTTAATAAIAAATAAASAVRTGLGLIDLNSSAAVVLTIQGGNRRLGFRVAAHLDKGKPLALAGAAIADNLGTLNRAVGAEHFFQVRAFHIIAQISDIQLLTHKKNS